MLKVCDLVTFLQIHCGYVEINYFIVQIFMA